MNFSSSSIEDKPFSRSDFGFGNYSLVFCMTDDLAHIIRTKFDVVEISTGNYFCACDNICFEIEHISFHSINNACEFLKRLFVENRAFDDRTITALLEGMGHQEGTFGYGFSEVESLCQNQDKLMLINIQLSGIDGFEITDRIRGSQETGHPRVPIMALISRDSSVSLDDLETCAPALLLKKSCFNGDLAHLIDRINKPGRQVPPRTLNPWSLHPDYIRSSFPMKQCAMNQVVELFRESCTDRIAQVYQAFGKLDEISIMARNIHALRGSLSMFASELTLEIATELEHQIERGDTDLIKEHLSRLETAIESLQPTLDSLIGETD